MTKANFIGRFINFYVVDEKEYRKKKKESLIKREKQREEAEVKRQVEDAMFIRMISLPKKLQERLGPSLMAEILGISRQWFYIKMKKHDEMKEFE